jgi:phosphoribosylformylglycinamidine synthase subunit PurSL
MTAINTLEIFDKQIGNIDTISALEESLRDVGIKNARAFSTSFYTLNRELTEKELEEISQLVHHSVTQDVVINKPLESGKKWDFAIKVDYKPGVTDNAARVLSADLSLAGISDTDVYTSFVHYISGKLDENLREQLERVSSNPQIHDISILTEEQFREQDGFERKIHPVNLGERANYFNINLGEMTHEELLKTGKLGTLNLDLVIEGMTERERDQLRGGTLSLAEDYMEKILEYSLSDLNTQGGNQRGCLTDTELELLAQMWSEHCRHSLYNASIPQSQNGIFQKYIKDPTLKVLAKKPHLGVSIYKDNSGVFQFNDKWNILLKNETHNSPSALDPFGGAITGIVGVNRDPAGTGVGGEVIGNFLFYFLGHPEDKRRYFKTKITEEESEELPMAADRIRTSFRLENLLLNPKQIFDGVVSGVEQGANQMGISLNLGICQYHDNYNGKPIVGVGSFGRMPRLINGQLSHEKHIDIGDRLYIIGGRAGRDGIHGATFSSEELSANSPATAVQIGDPYTQRKTFEALLELRDKGYIKFITDLGAGGVSCAALEMAEETGGLEIDLDKLLKKYPGMTATEIFLNESQERMAVAVNESNKEDIEMILRKHEVEFSDIGVFTDSGRAIVHANDDKVVDMDMDFIHKGFPKRTLNPGEYKLSGDQVNVLNSKLNELVLLKLGESGQSFEDYIRAEFYDMLKRPNLGSVAGFTDKMDSTVKGLSVQHCIQGKGRVSTKTSCTLVDIESSEGLIQSYGHTERQSYIDSELMGKNSFLRSIGNSLSMGGRLDYMVATDQALWQSSDTPEYQQMLIESNQGMAEVIEGCELPVISGKDSMYNQATVYDQDGNVVKRGVFPTLLMTTMAKIDNVDNIVTIDAKHEGDLVYVIGSITKNDLGGSEFFNMYGEMAGEIFNVGKVSNEDVKDVYDTFRRVDEANKKGLMQSSNYIENGGLMTAINQTAIAGEKGIRFDVNELHQEEGLNLTQLMYSETEGRFLVTVKQKDREEFERLFDGKYSNIGVVIGDKIDMKNNGNVVLSERVDEMLKIYHKMKEAA